MARSNPCGGTTAHGPHEWHLDPPSIRQECPGIPGITARMRARQTAWEALPAEVRDACYNAWDDSHGSFREVAIVAFAAGMAAGRTRAAAEIRKKIADSKHLPNSSQYAMDVLELAAVLAEKDGTDG